MNKVFQPIQQACDLLGGQANLARAIDVSPSFVYQWLNSLRAVPASYCKAIESATKGVVTCKALRPDDWQAFWPELLEQKA